MQPTPKRFRLGLWHAQSILADRAEARLQEQLRGITGAMKATIPARETVSQDTPLRLDLDRQKPRRANKHWMRC